MHIGIAIRHPEHVNFFGPIAARLRAAGHEVRAFVREHGHTTTLLDATEMPYDVLATEPTSRLSLVGGHLRYEAKLFRAVRRHGVDVLTSVGGRAVSNVAPLANARSVVFIDWEGTAADAAVAALADAVCTPRFLSTDFGESQVEYEGFHELAYLHPDWFAPDGERLSAAGVDPDETFAIVGFRTDDDRTRSAAKGVRERLGEPTVLYRSHEHAAAVGEDGFDGTVPPASAHDALAAADLYVGDSATMATEAALLGTPAVRLRPEGTRVARCTRLQHDYGLLYSSPNGDVVAGMADEILSDPTAADRFDRRRDRVIDDADDVAAFAADQVVRGGVA